jgi:hypothetical protein
MIQKAFSERDISAKSDGTRDKRFWKDNHQINTGKYQYEGTKSGKTFWFLSQNQNLDVGHQLNNISESLRFGVDLI